MGNAEHMRPLRLVGRFEVFDEIDSGGMATVHLGRQGAVGGFAKIVAIKRMHAQYAKDPQFVAMFLDEARLVARIDHPNVLKTLDLIKEAGELFIVMEYVPGATLRQLVAETSRRDEGIPMKTALSMICGMLHGLHAAHEAKKPSGESLELVHRDVSPENVLVGTDGVTRLLDFGMARALGKLHVTQVGQVKGKLTVMAPEQVQGQPVSRLTDVFASGVVLWQTLTGQRLLKGEHMSEIAHSVLHQPFDPPSRLVPSLPKKLDSIVMRALERDPGKRWQTAEKMAAALEAVGDLETRRQVGQWVEKVVWKQLQERAKLVAAIEATPQGLETSGSLPVRAMVPEDSVGPVAKSGLHSRDRIGEAVAIVSAVARRLLDGGRNALSAARERDHAGRLRMSVTVQRVVTRRPRVTIGVALGLTAFVTVLALSLGATSDDEGEAAPGPSAKATVEPSAAVALDGSARSAPAARPVASAVPAGDVVTVPAGEFLMGCNSWADPLCAGDEMPGHQIALEAFAIDRTEVTVIRYRACVAESACTDEHITRDGIEGKELKEMDKCNFGRDGRGEHPMNCVSHSQAEAYCRWAGGRLPTEAEWERAARGGDSWAFPTGEATITCDKAIMSEHGDGCGRGTSSPVGARRGGASPHGALDMAGNVSEWVGDWYEPTYYRTAPAKSPTGPPEGSLRVVRGGHWRDRNARLLRTSARDKRLPGTHSITIGFRCVHTK